MPEPFLTFQRFNDLALAQIMADLLQAGGIEVMLENDAPLFDPSYAFNTIDPDIHLTIRAADFTRAHGVLVDYYRAHLSEVDPDYYLYSFTDEELRTILAQPDAWGAFDYALAEQILTDRGQPLTVVQTEQLQAERVAELAHPEPMSKTWLVMGYAFLVFIPVAACIQGGIIAYYKKTLPNGERVYAYRRTDRRYGQILLVIAAIVQVVMVLFTGSWII